MHLSFKQLFFFNVTLIWMQKLLEEQSQDQQNEIDKLKSSLASCEKAIDVCYWLISSQIFNFLVPNPELTEKKNLYSGLYSSTWTGEGRDSLRTPKPPKGSIDLVIILFDERKRIYPKGTW